MRFLIILFVLLFAGCENPLAPYTPDGAVKFDPPPPFRTYWEDVEKDSGLSGDFDSVQWFVVEGGPWEYEGRLVRGGWSKRGNRIFIADTHMQDTRVIFHEILHALLREGDHEHPLFSTPKYRSDR